MGRTFGLILALAVPVVALPLLGVALAGMPPAPYLAFPPLTVPVAHAPFAWPAFLALSILVLACLAPFVYRLSTASPAAVSGSGEARRALPAWGWLGLALLAVSWVLAWNRFAWLAPVQRHTFTPIWLGYIVLINALTFRRTGQCLLLDRPRRMLLLFPVSAVFWWLFEYLNRFVQNWYYVGVAGLEPWQYFWQATLPFATVLPAVLSTRDYLASFPRLCGGLRDAWRLRVARPRALAVLALCLCAAALAGIGVWPELLYPLVWVAPLALLVSQQVLRREPTILAPLAHGDWRELWLAALAALLCGFFWELWNVNSLARWEYAIPYVHRFQIFEMPLLGYAGYLPFGLLCVAVGRMLESAQ